MISEAENDLIVTAMLNNNEIIEEALTEWIYNQQDIYATAKVFKCIQDRDQRCGGLIVSVESGSISAGADNIEFFNGNKHVSMNRVKGKLGESYIMIFTSRERFRQYNNTAGIVMFIRELFSFLGNLDGVEGIVINMGKEDVVIDRIMLNLISNFLEVGDKNQG